MRTFNDNADARRGHPETPLPPRSRFEHGPPSPTSASSGRSAASPTSRTDPSSSTRTATRPSTSRSRACARRFEATSGKHLVIGVSGGLDSTHALIVAAKACDRLGLPRTTILGFTMPGFATGEATKAQRLGADERARRHRRGDRHPPGRASRCSRDMGHPFAEGEPVYDVTFENVQAGLRTDYLFRLANQRGGFVVGTGDLSELALGWCTYGVGDQMSHYDVNAGVPKTLIQYLIRWAVRTDQFDRATDDVLAGDPRHQDLARAGPGRRDKGEMQSTEDKIGPYELHDFFLYHILRYGLPPSKVAFLAWHAWRDPTRGDGRRAFPRRGDTPTTSDIRKWLRVFLGPLLPHLAVQALRPSQRPQGLGRRRAIAARRLARAVRRDRGSLALGARAKRPETLMLARKLEWSKECPNA